MVLTKNLLLIMLLVNIYADYGKTYKIVFIFSYGGHL